MIIVKSLEEIKFTPDYEAGKPVFSRIFEELSNEGNGLVHYNKLQERLVSTGKFDAGEAVLMIEHMEKIDEIQQTEQYHVYRRTKTASSVQVHRGDSKGMKDKIEKN